MSDLLMMPEQVVEARRGEPMMAMCVGCERCVEVDEITHRRIPGGDETEALCYDCREAKR